MMVHVKLPITTDGSGNGSATTGHLNGILHKIRYVKDALNPYANGMDFTVTVDDGEEVVFTGTDVNDSASFHPTEDSVDEAGGARLYAASGEPVAAGIPIDDTITIAVAQGGADNDGEFHLWVG